MNSTDQEIISRMAEHGGSFVFALAMAARHADAENLERLKKAFPELWQKYSQVQTHVAAALIEKYPIAEYQKDE